MKINILDLEWNIGELAEHEFRWWEAYHTQNRIKLLEEIIAVTEKRWGITIDEKVANYFVEATDNYIQFKEALKLKSEDLAVKYRMKARLNLGEYYRLVGEKIKEEESKKLGEAYEKEVFVK